MAATARSLRGVAFTDGGVTHQLYFIADRLGVDEAAVERACQAVNPGPESDAPK